LRKAAKPPVRHHNNGDLAPVDKVAASLSPGRRQHRPGARGLHNRRFRNVRILRSRQGELRRLASPMAEQDHLAHDVLVRQRLSRVLATLDRDFNNARIVASEPDVGSAPGQNTATGMSSPLPGT
jgi:hypothetical protein